MARQDQSERAGPELADELAHGGGNVVGHNRDTCEVAAGRDVDDERVKRRPLLGGKHLGDSHRIEGVCRQAIDGFGGKGDNFPLLQQGASLTQGVLHVIVGGL